MPLSQAEALLAITGRVLNYIRRAKVNALGIEGVNDTYDLANMIDTYFKLRPGDHGLPLSTEASKSLALPVVAISSTYEARALDGYSPDSIATSGWELVKDQENADSEPVVGDNYDAVLAKAVETIRRNADDSHIDTDHLVIARVTVEYIKPEVPPPVNEDSVE